MLESDYDRYTLVPSSISKVRSRNDVKLNSDFLDLLPIMGSPMIGVSGVELCVALGRLNCLGIYHRFHPIPKRKQDIFDIAKERVPFGIAISVDNWKEELDIAEMAVDNGACLILADLANGYLPQVAEMGLRLRNRLGDKIKLMTGNIIDAIGAQYAKDSGYDMVRVSIGSGNVCITRTETGVTRNALNALLDCQNINIDLVIDGGIRQPGDLVKAFGCGAKFGMLGSALAYANEAEDKNGVLFGSASLDAHLFSNKEVKSIEGRKVQLDLSQKKPLKEIIDRYLWGVRSACTYLNSPHYMDLQNNAILVPSDEKLC